MLHSGAVVSCPACPIMPVSGSHGTKQHLSTGRAWSKSGDLGNEPKNLTRNRAFVGLVLLVPFFDKERASFRKKCGPPSPGGGDFLAEANMVHMASRVASAEELARMQEKMRKMMRPGWSSATLFM